MKNSKSQTPSSREHPNPKYQTSFGKHCKPSVAPWSLKFGASLVLGCWCLVLLFCPNAHAQSYSIDWFTIDGGGGTSTNGQYSLSGTIGQPDAGATMTGGNYSLDGGFWAFAAVVQTPGAPLLTITVTAPNTVVVSWPSPSTGFVLQTNNNLATGNWGNFLGTIFDIGDTRNVTNQSPVGNLFFRLKSP